MATPELRADAAATLPDYKPLAQLVETGDGPALRWDTSQRRALTPRQAVTASMVLGGLGMLGAAAGWLTSHPGLSIFFTLQALATWLLFLHYARHACDHETITLVGSHLEVDRQSGLHSCHDAFDVDWVRVQCDDDTRGFVRLSQRQAAVTVGRHLSPPGRWLMAQELRRALGYRRACMP